MAVIKVIVNDKGTSGALLGVPLIILCQYGRSAPTRYPFADSVSTSKANE
jgi:hypothetical protein